MKRVLIAAMAACGLLVATAANYTLTNTTVEWPSSNEAENVSGNRYTIVGDVTVVITNVPVANVSLGALRANMVVTDGATLTVDFTDVEADRIRMWGALVTHGTGKIRMKGDATRIAYGMDGSGVSVLPSYVFDAPDFAFVDANGDVLDIPLTFSGCSAVRRWPNCGHAFAEARIGLIGDGGVMLEPDVGTDTIALSTTGLTDLLLYNDTSLDPSTKVNVPTGCRLYMKPATYSTNSLAWSAKMWGTNSTDVVLAGGKLSLQSMPDHDGGDGSQSVPLRRPRVHVAAGKQHVRGGRPRPIWRREPQIQQPSELRRVLRAGPCDEQRGVGRAGAAGVLRAGRNVRAERHDRFAGGNRRDERPLRPRGADGHNQRIHGNV